MSYQITAYFSDAGISSTQIVVTFGGTYVGYYGDNEMTISGIDTPATFTAVAAGGYSFRSWTYRVGSISAPAQTSYDNPFVYEGTQDIYIHADSTGGGGGNWNAVDGGVYSNISSPLNLSPNIPESTMIRYALSFSDSGTANFEGSTLLYAYLSDTDQYDPATGQPLSIIASDTAGGYTFSFSCAVTSGTTYYFWVRCIDRESSAQGGATITPPSPTPPPTPGGGIHIYNGSAWVKATPYIYNGSAWVQATPYIYNGSAWVQAT